MMYLEDPHITTAWMLLANGDEQSVVRGQALLTQLLQHVEAMHNTRKVIQVLALQAWAYDLQGRMTEALDVLESALALARPGGFIRTFAEYAIPCQIAARTAQTPKSESGSRWKAR